MEKLMKWSRAMPLVLMVVTLLAVLGSLVGGYSLNWVGEPEVAQAGKGPVNAQMGMGAQAGGEEGKVEPIEASEPVYRTLDPQDEKRVQKIAISRPGAGLPTGSVEGEMRKGFAITAVGLHTGKRFVVTPDRLVCLSSMEGNKQRKLSAEEWDMLRTIPQKTKGLWGFVVMNQTRTDQEVVRLYETPDARGQPVLETVGVSMPVLDDLRAQLAKMINEPGAEPVAEGDPVLGIKGK